METLSLIGVARESRLMLLNELGFDSDGIYVLNKDRSKLLDKYIGQPIKIDNMVILPGSIIILDDNPLSIASYFEEYGERI